MQAQHSHRCKDHENFGWPALVEEGYKTKALDITKNYFVIAMSIL